MLVERFLDNPKISILPWTFFSNVLDFKFQSFIQVLDSCSNPSSHSLILHRWFGEFTVNSFANIIVS
jgi:hypothetical protein